MISFGACLQLQMSDMSDETKGKPMQITAQKCCFLYYMLYAEFLSKIPSDSILLFSAAMAQIKIPKTALATTSAIEYPICSPAVAVTPEIPIILMMYTHGYVNQEMIVSQRAYAVRDETDGACFELASLNPTASSATTYKNGIMAKNHHIHRPLALFWISPG